MLNAADYKLDRSGDWFFWTLERVRDAAMQRSAIALVERQPASKHPQTLRLSWPAESSGQAYFVKAFHRGRGAGKVKDLLRASKARRFWRQGLLLAAAGFNVPLTVAFAERRRGGVVQRSFVLTEALSGLPAPQYLSGLDIAQHSRAFMQMKRSAIAQLGALIRRFHDLGFVHGDLLASNILVVMRKPDRLSFYFMDNDRTRRFPPWLTVQLCKRNLVQLNRLPLAHITVQDRMRFFHAYLGVSKLRAQDRQLARWLEARTRRRRMDCDGADPNENFRRLMRWVPDTTDARHS